MISNVPSDAKLRVDVYDKDEGSIGELCDYDATKTLIHRVSLRSLVDDYIGSFTTWLTEGAQIQTLRGLTNHDKGTMGFQVRSYSASFKAPHTHHRYLIDTEYYTMFVSPRSRPNPPRIRICRNTLSMALSDTRDTLVRQLVLSPSSVTRMDLPVVFGLLGRSR